MSSVTPMVIRLVEIRAQMGLGIDDIVVELRMTGMAVDRNAIKAIVMSAGGHGDRDEAGRRGPKEAR